jgi:hypothetical protein
MDISCFSKRAHLCTNSTGILWNESTLKQVTAAVEENQLMKLKRFKSGPSRGERTRNFHREKWFTSGALDSQSQVLLPSLPLPGPLRQFQQATLAVPTGYSGSSNKPLWQFQQATQAIPTGHSGGCNNQTRLVMEVHWPFCPAAVQFPLPVHFLNKLHNSNLM